MSMHERPKIGVGVLVLKDAFVLLGKRIGSVHGNKTWCPPGGHLEYGEEPIACAIRETKEECGLTISRVRPGPYTNDIFPEKDRHYITLHMLAVYEGGDPALCEPDRFSEWRWFSWNALPEPLFLSLQHLKESGFDPFSRR